MQQLFVVPTCTVKREINNFVRSELQRPHCTTSSCDNFDIDK